MHLIENINLSAGLVNLATGTGVKVIYNNADIQLLIDGKHPAPYYIIVEFPKFHGFIVKECGNQRIFLFSSQR